MSYTVSLADPARDQDAILGIWRSAFPGMPMDRFAWMYLQNPGGTPVCCIARDDAGAPVGFAAVVPRLFHHDGGAVSGGIAADFAIVEGHRGFGPAMTLQRAVVTAACEAGYRFVYGVPTPQAAVVLRRVGFSTTSHPMAFTRVLQVSRWMTRPGLRTLGNLMGPAADLAWNAFWSGRTIRYSRSDHTSLEPTAFDERFDHLNHRIAKSGPLVGDRSSRYLNWRFMESPHAQHEIFAVGDTSQRTIEGYVVYHSRGGRTIIDDLAGLPSALDPLLRSFARAQRERGASAIALSCIAPRHLQDRLPRHGFLQRGTGSHGLMVRSCSDAEGGHSSEDNARFWWFNADNDV